MAISKSVIPTCRNQFIHLGTIIFRSIANIGSFRHTPLPIPVQKPIVVGYEVSSATIRPHPSHVPIVAHDAFHVTSSFCVGYFMIVIQTKVMAKFMGKELINQNIQYLSVAAKGLLYKEVVNLHRQFGQTRFAFQ